MAIMFEVEQAINDIVNEAIVHDDRKMPVQIILDDIGDKYGAKVRKPSVQSLRTFVVYFDSRLGHMRYSDVGILMADSIITCLLMKTQLVKVCKNFASSTQSKSKRSKNSKKNVIKNLVLNCKVLKTSFTSTIQMASERVSLAMSKV